MKSIFQYDLFINGKFAGVATVEADNRAESRVALAASGKEYDIAVCTTPVA